MIRALTILAAVVALVVSAAPASAGLLSSPLGLTTKPKPAVYDHGITQGRKPQPRGTAGCTPIGEVGFPKVAPASCCTGSHWSFMDYTDDSCMAKTTGSRLKAAPKQPRATVTRSVGETLSSDWVKSPAAMRLTAVKDGTSNTLMLGEGLVGQMEVVNQRKLGAGKDRGWVKALPKPPQNGASGFMGKYIDLDGRF